MPSMVLLESREYCQLLQSLSQSPPDLTDKQWVHMNLINYRFSSLLSEGGKSRRKKIKISKSNCLKVYGLAINFQKLHLSIMPHWGLVSNE